MPRVTQIDATNAAAVWTQQESENSSKNDNKNQEPDQDSEINKK